MSIRTRTINKKTTLLEIIESVRSLSDDEEKSRLFNSLYIHLNYQMSPLVLFRYFFNSWKYTKRFWIAPVHRFWFCLYSSLELSKLPQLKTDPPSWWTKAQQMDYYKGKRAFLEGDELPENISSEFYAGYYETGFKNGYFRV